MTVKTKRLGKGLYETLGTRFDWLVMHTPQNGFGYRWTAENTFDGVAFQTANTKRELLNDIETEEGSHGKA